MITKAIVEELVSPYQVRVRIPILDRAHNSMLSTDSKNLNIATICTLPNCYINVQVGDVVFVGFEDNTYHKAVILGHLCRESMSSTYSDVTFNSITVNDRATFSSNTTIGDVSSSEIKHLQGVRDNIQKQLDSLQHQVDLLFSKSEAGKT